MKNRLEFIYYIWVFFSDVMEDLYNWINPKTSNHSPMISDDIIRIIRDNADVSSVISDNVGACDLSYNKYLET